MANAHQNWTVTCWITISLPSLDLATHCTFNVVRCLYLTFGSEGNIFVCLLCLHYAILTPDYLYNDGVLFFVPHCRYITDHHHLTKAILGSNTPDATVSTILVSLLGQHVLHGRNRQTYELAY